VLTAAEEKGLYREGAVTEVRSTGLAAWLVNAYLHSSSTGRANLHVVVTSPAFFPLRLPLVTGPDVVSASQGRVDVMRHASQEELAVLSRPGSAQQTAIR
jgi:hypothetical protein